MYAYSTRLSARIRRSTERSSDAPPWWTQVGRRVVQRVEAQVAQAMTEVDVLAVEEEPLVQTADQLQGLAPDEDAGPGEPVGMARSRVDLRDRG